jgi:hypothetical protein
MTYPEIIDLLLKIHASILGGALVLFYTYSDRTDGFASSLKGVSAVLAELRRRIMNELDGRLSPIFKNAGAVPSPLLGPDGDTYYENPINPFGNEAYREAIREFIEDNSILLADYRSLSASSHAWCFWANKLNWFILFLFIWQVITVFVTLCVKLKDVPFSEYIMVALVVPTLGLALACLLAVVGRYIYFTRLTRFRMRYGEL